MCTLFLPYMLWCAHAMVCICDVDCGCVWLFLYEVCSFMKHVPPYVHIRCMYTSSLHRLHHIISFIPHTYHMHHIHHMCHTTCTTYPKTQVLALSLDRCITSLNTHRWVTVSTGRERKAPVPPPPPPAAGAAGGATEPTPGGDDVAPPVALMEHPPLAIFANGVLSALNELRHCASLSLRTSVIAALQVGDWGVGGRCIGGCDVLYMDTHGCCDMIVAHVFLPHAFPPTISACFCTNTSLSTLTLSIPTSLNLLLSQPSHLSHLSTRSHPTTRNPCSKSPPPWSTMV